MLRGVESSSGRRLVSLALKTACVRMAVVGRLGVDEVRIRVSAEACRWGVLVV